MNSKFLILLCALFFFEACGNKDYGYNQKSADNFLKVMEKLDESHESLTSKRFKPGIDSADVKNSDWQDAAGKVEYINNVIENTNELKHSQKAKVFHTQVLKYYNDVKSNYYGTLKKYLLAKDAAQQSSFYEQLIAIRKTLTEEENKSLEIQNKFLKDLGIAN